jgi:hypothetical protein
MYLIAYPIVEDTMKGRRFKCLVQYDYL